MATEKRIKILIESEVQEFYSQPLLTVNHQWFIFALDERERLTCKKMRQRRTRCMLAWNECARLVANAIIYFNSNVLSRRLIASSTKKYNKRLRL